MLDVAVRYRVTPSLALFARGSNLLDEDYEQVYGYRTPASSKSQERWDFAQIYSAKWIIIWSGIMFATCGLAYLAFPKLLIGKSEYGLAIMMCFIVIPIIQTEMALRKKFR